MSEEEKDMEMTPETMMSQVLRDMVEEKGTGGVMQLPEGVVVVVQTPAATDLKEPETQG
jgi:hypothetical protein